MFLLFLKSGYAPDPSSHTVRGSQSGEETIALSAISLQNILFKENCLLCGRGKMAVAETSFNDHTQNLLKIIKESVSTHFAVSEKFDVSNAVEAAHCSDYCK